MPVRLRRRERNMERDMRLYMPTEVEADSAIESGDPEKIKVVLVSGSRRLDDAWVIRCAPPFLEHPDALVRWAAVFALHQAKATLVAKLKEDFKKPEEDLKLLFILEDLSAHDPDARVRGLVASLFGGIIFLLLSKEWLPIPPDRCSIMEEHEVLSRARSSRIKFLLHSGRLHSKRI
jgi:hypothetical protein